VRACGVCVHVVCVRVWCFVVCLCLRVVCLCVRACACVRACGVVLVFLKIKQLLAGKRHADDDLHHAASCHGPVE
jgi:hypothetical protein